MNAHHGAKLKHVLLIQNASPQGSFYLVQPALQFQCFGAFVGFDIDHHIADPGIGLQVLTGDIDALFGEDRVDGGEHAGLVAMDVQQAALAGMLGQGNLREIDSG